VKVKVMGVDLKAKRIALSIKALLPPAGRGPSRPQQQPQAKPQISMEDKLSMLSNKWKTR